MPDLDTNRPPWRDFAFAPLVPIALAATLGLCVDRYVAVPTRVTVVLGLLALISAFMVRRQDTRTLFLWLTYALAAAGYHHATRNDFPVDDVSHVLGLDAQLIRLRGVIAEEPNTRATTEVEYGRKVQRRNMVFLMTCTERASESSWRHCLGTVRVHLDATEQPDDSQQLEVGDTVEVLGRIRAPNPPNNPGMSDSRELMRDDGIRADVYLENQSTLKLQQKGSFSLARCLTTVRRYGRNMFASQLPPREAATAQALVLGDGSQLQQDTWDAYIRTGVVHVLVISGQHFAMVAACLWWLLRLVGVRRYYAAFVVIAALGIYAVVTGLQPSAVRAFLMASLFCGSLIVRRRANTANSFAAAWLAVIALNPTDIFSLGCRLSFLTVYVLIWWLGPMFLLHQKSPLEKLIDESRGPLERSLRQTVSFVSRGYLLSMLILFIVAPLLVHEQNMFPLVALGIGPVLVLLTTLALMFGLAVLCLTPFGLGSLFAWPLQQLLSISDVVVNYADALPAANLTLPAPPSWWVAGFYMALLMVVLFQITVNLRYACCVILYLLIPLLPMMQSRNTAELSVTMLAVGKGGCAVLEMPDGRCMIYDAGSTIGSSAMRRIVVPFLLSRGITRIDEIIISHGDADHFNGLVELLRRFSVGMVSLTPSFAEKPTWEVEETLTALRKAGVQTRIVYAGMTLHAGEVDLRVLHPPKVGPPGIENERSLVLLVTHAGHRILLTGDLERSGTQMVLTQPIEAVDVMTAPHHGSRAASPRLLCSWCKPKLVVVSRGVAMGNSMTTEDVLPGCLLRDTDTHGATTIISTKGKLVAEFFTHQERVVLEP